MVGVPKSNACLLCLNRRKKCDGRRPECTPCRQRGVLCPGYRDKFQFVEEKQQHDKESKLPQYTARAGNASSADSRAGAARQTPDPPPWDGDMSLIQPRPLPVSMQSTVFQQQLVDKFQNIYVPHRRSNVIWGRLGSNIQELPSWIWLVPTVHRSTVDPLLNDIVLALVLGNIGLWENNARDLHVSAWLHARAVQRLRLRIKDKNESKSDSTLAAVMIFGIYELQIGSTNRGEGYFAHLRGVNALLALRGPAVFESAYGRKLFWGSQFNQFVMAVKQRGCPRAMRPDFREDEMRICSMPTDVRLYPIIQRLPPLMAQVDQFQRIVEQMVKSYGASQASRMAECVYQDLLALEANLKRWEVSLSRSSPLYWSEPSVLYALNFHHHRISDALATRLCFPSVRIGFALILSWATSLIISSIKRPLLLHVENKGLPDDHSTALNIARSLEYFLHPDMGLIGTNLIGLSVEIAREFFVQNGSPDEKVWFEVIDARMLEMRTGLGTFLRDMRQIGPRTL